MGRYFYYIKNSKSEFRSSISGYFETLDEAKEALKECENWWRPKGTGTIYRQEFGMHKDPVEVYHKY